MSSAEYNDVKAGTTTSTNQTVSAIVIPRTVPANTGFIKVVKEGKTFTYNLTKEIKLESDKSYSYTVNLKEKQIHIDIGTEISGTQYAPATAMLGEGWHMPTKEECEELMNGCTSHATSTSGTTYFFVFTSKTNGNTISFGGYSTASPSIGFGDYGAYFLSSTLTYNSVNLIEVTADYHKATTWDRHWEYQIRPVYDGD